MTLKPYPLDLKQDQRDAPLKPPLQSSREISKPVSGNTTPKKKVKRKGRGNKNRGKRRNNKAAETKVRLQ